MKAKLLITWLIWMAPMLVSAQLLNPVKWTFSVQKTGEGDYALHMQASIDNGWHMYAQNAGEGPIPASFTFDTANAAALQGKVEEHGTLVEKYDSVFSSKLRYYEHTVDFVQKVHLSNDSSQTIKGSLEYMVCDDHQCIPPKTVPFSFTVGSDKLSAQQGNPAADATPARSADTVSATPDKVTAIAQDDASNKSLWWIFWACFAGGFLALVTPCVFSMIPITVSFFTKRSETRAAGIRNAIYYSLSIILIYTLLGFLITVLFGASALNQLSSNIWANLAFFLIFLLFGISFLGAFDINLPSSWASSTDTKAGLGSFFGIFFMALTLTIVSFSCTGPIIGNLLVLAAGGGKSGPLIGMFGFSLALAIPFALFAIFPSWLSRIGKAGGWLNAVKVVLGLMELALAMKFLSNVDMAYHWGILSKEVFLALWIVIFALIGFYLLGKIRFAHDSAVEHISVPRLFFALAAFAFTVYLVPGLFGGELKGIMAGFLPNYSSIDYAHGNGQESAATSAYGDIRPQKYVDIFGKATPVGYTAFYDYDEAMAAAKKLKRPLMIDFTGWSCVNCRKMENAVWTDAGVQKLIHDDFVLLQLYVDDRTALPGDEQYTSSFDGSHIKTVGGKNADFEIVKFTRNSQPYYVFLDQKGSMLSDKGYAYDPDPQRFIAFLEKVKAEYQKRNP